MPVCDLAPGGTLTTSRGEAVVCIPLHGAHEHFVRCLGSVLAHTRPEVPILVADDAGPDPASRAWAERLDLDRDVHWLRQPENLGFVGNCNAAFAAAAPADVVLLNSDCEVSEGWFEGLRDAAHSDSTIATASALTNNGTILSVPHRNAPVDGLPKHLTFDDAAARVRAESPRLRPRIPTAIGHCVYVRREAIDLTGGFDVSFAPAYGEEVDFSQRCLLHGLQHVAADDVLVLHRGAASYGTGNPIQEQHERLLRSRYPYYEGLVAATERDDTSPLARSLGAASQALLEPAVSIDGRCLTSLITGTQIHTLELIAALHRAGGVRLRVVTPEDLGTYAHDVLSGLTGVELHPYDRVSDKMRVDDIVHRPYQVSSNADLGLFELLGRRIVVTHHDLIAYRNPGYFPSHQAYAGYQRLTRRTLLIADLVLFVSEHARADALAEDLLEPERGRVIPNGVDHTLTALEPEPEAPREAARLTEAPYLLCLGTDFRHKNRRFGLELFAALLERGWDGRMVFAGPPVAHGSSTAEEAEWLSLHPDAASRLVELPSVSEGEKRWLYEHAAALLYPTTYEGFGLVPFEAAQHGVPCLWAPQTSLPEVLGELEAPLVAWDAAESAERCLPLLRDRKAASAQIEAIRERGRAFTWDAAARSLVAAYRDVVRLPARPVRRLAADAVQIEAERGEWEGKYWHLRNEVGSTGLSLVGPEGELPDEAQRALAGLVRRKSTRRLTLATLRAIGRGGGNGR